MNPLEVRLMQHHRVVEVLRERLLSCLHGVELTDRREVRLAYRRVAQLSVHHKDVAPSSHRLEEL